MKRKLSIIKNGYDVLRIIEMGKGEFKITNETGINDFDVYAEELFLKPKYFNFDKRIEWEISYHASNNESSTKIHLKNRKSVEYLTLPLTHLVDSDVNTEIPIPLFKILIPNVALKKKYKDNIKGDKDHVVIDIENNNSVEIFLTSSDYIKNNYSLKWENMINTLISTDIRYYATNSCEYVNLNNYYFFKNNVDETRIISRCATITDNIGIMVNTINILDLNTNKLTFLFIDNSEYLTFLANMKFKDPQTEQILKLYKYDFKNYAFFSQDEMYKWENIFDKKWNETKKLIKKYSLRIIEQQRYEEKFNEERKELLYKCATFLMSINSIKVNILKKYNLIDDKEEKDINKDLINDVKFDFNKLCNVDLKSISDIEWWFINGLFTKQLDITLLFCKYLNINTPMIFKYTIQSKKCCYNCDEKNNLPEIITDDNLCFDYVRLLYSEKYDIELFRGVLNMFLDNKKENNILICQHFNTVNEYMRYGISERIKLENKYNIFDEGVFRFSEEQFKNEMEKNDNLLIKVYDLIIDDINNNKTMYD